ncbi:ABC transporter permease [Actinophytocola oryzae]|uniref:Putative ABC transport system permease protein n=1 Tax=Actinophytocola oryzae TaxID=502181 RepID=A0A4R7VZH1_9PSEU|nr:ABC transporter permease [Actinophytocola oryzae]TDV55185.1 putative ABC transport system permease protein [Actinophytocola oryzae]
MNVVFGWQLVAVLVLLVAAAAAVVGVGRIGSWRPVVTAAARAVAQLAAVSLVIVLVLKSGWLTAGFVLLMFSIAAWTSARRITKARHSRWAAVPIAGGVAPILALLLATRVVPTHPIAVIPIAGILIGGAMTATSLAGRRALDELVSRRGEYEAALALGLRTADAARLIVRPTAGQALVPALDQTRTVGLVTLPGTFVGILLGGGSPVQAGATQLLVLVALLAIEAVAVLITVELVAARKLRPVELP